MTFTPSYYPYDPNWSVPTKEECFKYWEEFDLPVHIREHSSMVAVVADEIYAQCPGNIAVPREALTAAALLHDLGKFYCIEHGGLHNQLGASLVMDITGNPAIAQGVMHHVYWPGDVDIKKFFLPLVLIYSDKRVKHDKIVSLEDRFDDLFSRYGINAQMNQLIQKSLSQALAIQEQLKHELGINLNASTFNSRRLV